MASSSFYSGSGVTPDNTDVDPVAPNNITAIEDSKNAAALSEAAAAASATAAANSAASITTSVTTATTKASESSASATASATSAAASQVSRLASEVAKVASETAKTATETARDAAASSSTAATASQAAASSSETNSANSAAAALASKNAAATSATSAAAEAANSATSAAASEVSNVASGVAKVAAETAETNAETAQAASEAARDAAAVSQAAAATSETNAASSEGVATTQAGIATTKASEAAASAAASEASKVAAAASQVASSNSQVAAASSAASAAAIFDQFDDTYLGSKTSAPTVDNDGNALVTGSLYYNSATGGMFIWSGTEWIAASAAGGASLNNFSFTASANQTTFSGSDDNSNTMSYVQDNLIVVLNGVILEAGTDYTATNGSSIILSSGAAANDELNVVAFKSFTTADMVSSSNGGTFYNNVDFSAGIDVTGNITVTGTVDGRDVAADGALAASAIQPGDLATVATSGSFNDLSDKPSPFDPSTLATVATSGAYSDLSGTPTFGTAATAAATDFVAVTGDTMTGDLDVQGTITSDGLTVAPDANRSLNIATDGTYSLIVENTSTNSGADLTFKAKDDIVIKCNDIQTFRTSAGGDISFYDSTGTTPKFFWDSSAESLGIGGPSPAGTQFVVTNSNAEGLEIRPTGGLSGGTSITAYNRSAAAYIPQTYNASEHIFVNSGSSNQKMRIDSSGNVGIGTSSPSSYNSGGYRLVVGDGAGYEGITIASGSTQEGSLYFADGTTGNATYRGHISYNHSDDSMHFKTAASERLRIDSSGNLLVGTTNTNTVAASGFTVHPDGQIFASSDNQQVLTLTRRGSDGEIARFRDSIGSIVGSIGSRAGADLYIGSGDTFAKFVRSVDAIVPANSDGSLRDNAINIGAATGRFKDLYLSGGLRGDTTFKNNAGTTEYARFDSSGHLLVGKTSADFGTAGIALMATDQLRVTRSGNTCGSFNRLSTDGDIVDFYGPGGSVGSIGVASSIPVFNTSTSTGALGVGGTRVYQWDSNQFYPLVDDAKSLGGSSYRFRDAHFSGTVNAANFNTTSDQTLKTNVETLTGSLDAVTALRGVSFDWLENGGSEIGVIAQEVEAVLPDVVSTNDEGIKSVKYGNMVAVLIEAIKEQQAQIDELKAKLGE